MSPLQQIPYIDLRGRTPIDLLRHHEARARDLSRSATEMFGLISQWASLVALPAGDLASKRWLEKTKNPYLSEIVAFVELLKIDGVYALNVCFEWGCTSSVYETSTGPKLLRVLDWPFPKLGEYIVVARQDGEAGDFFNVTWPGLSGVYQAMAPGRFAVAINQAPMRSYGSGIVLDWLRNRIETAGQDGLPPAHLLRQVFETAPDYREAVKRLCEMPIAVPAIFIVSGIEPWQGCVVERTETDFVLRDMDGNCVCATNHFQSRLNQTGLGWTARPVDSEGRVACARTLKHDGNDPFCWFISPIANSNSRLVMNASAAVSDMSVMGTEGIMPVTAAFSLTGALAERGAITLS